MKLSRLLWVLGVVCVALIVMGADKTASTSGDGARTSRVIIYPGTNENETVAQLQQQGVTRVEKYGSYWLADIDSTQLQSLKRAGKAQVQSASHFNQIELGEVTIDVTQGAPAVPQHLTDSGQGDQQLLIVQFKGPVLPEWLDLLKAVEGVQVVRYIPNNAYLVSARRDANAKVSALSVVQWVGAFHPFYKLPKSLREAKGVVTVNVTVFDDANAVSTQNSVKRYAIGEAVISKTGTGNWRIRLQVDAGDLGAIAQLPGVLGIQPVVPIVKRDEVQALVMAAFTNSSGGPVSGVDSYLSFLNGGSGSGVIFSQTPSAYPILDICDTGVDAKYPYLKNTSDFLLWHPSFYLPAPLVQSSFPSLSCGFLGISKKAYELGGSLFDTDGHGTRVASIAVGYDDQADEPFINCITQGATSNCTSQVVVVISTNGFTVGGGIECSGPIPPSCCATLSCTQLNLSVSVITNVTCVSACTTGDASLATTIPVNGPPWYLSRQDTDGFQLGLGVSPYGRFGVSSSDSAKSGPESVVLSAYILGARISNNSWTRGLSVGTTDGAYDDLSQSYDSLTRDAVTTGVTNTPGELPRNQQILFVFAGGNDNGQAVAIGGYGDTLVTPPATAKNVISVGATVLGHAPGNWYTIAPASSFGPTRDGRIKPDVVAPGAGVSAAISQSIASHGNCGLCDPNSPSPYACADGFETNQIVTQLYNDQYSWSNLVGPQYTLFPSVLDKTGGATSYSAAAVSGGAQLLYWYFQNALLQLPPTPAMMKAYIMNSARYLPIINPLTGAQDKLPSIAQGMGLMDLNRMFDGTPRVLRDESTTRAIDVALYATNVMAQQTYFTSPGQSYEVTGTVFSGTSPFRVTLAWTDAPGDPNVLKQLVNDLDLQVTVNGQTYAGNEFDTQFAAAVASPKYDRLNNVESVFLPAQPAGTPYRIQVRAMNIAGDGVPNVGSSMDQDFALVIYNSDPTGTSDAVPAATTNNVCQRALNIVSFPFVWTNNLTTANYANVHPSPSAGRGGIDEFFRVAHPSPGTRITVDTIGSGFDTVLSVWRGTCGSLVEVGSNNDASNTFQSAVTFTANGVDDYYIVAEPHNNIAGGQLVLRAVASTSPVIVTPSNINFPDTISGVTSAWQTVTLQNGLSIPLNVQSNVIVGADAPEFVILSSTCDGATLQSNGTCIINVAFAPTSTVALARSAQLLVYDDATGSPRPVSLTGNALPPAPLVQITPNTLSFGTQAVTTTSSPLDIQVKNIGTANLELSNAWIRLDATDFAISAISCAPLTPAVLTPGATCTFSITFTPGVGGPTNAVLSITNNTGVVEANLLGTGCSAINVTATLPVGAAGTPYNQVFAASGGNAPYTFDVAVGILPTGLTLSGSGVLSGTPTNLGITTFSIRATDAYGCSGANSFTITNICPSVTVLPATLPTTLQYAAYSNNLVGVGGIAPYTFAVTAGGLPSGLSLSPSGLLSGSVNTTNQLPFTITATDANGCAGTNVYTIPVTPAVPVLSPSPTSLVFTDQLLGTSSPAKYIVVNNTGTGPLNIYNVFFTGGNTNDFFIIANNCVGSAIPAGGNCLIGIVSAPTNSGPLSTTLRIISDATPATNNIAISGSGIAPSMGVAPASIDFGTNRVGVTSVPRSVTVTNTGNGPLIISDVSITGVNPADFSIVTNLCIGSPILPGASCRIQLTFKTSASLSRSAILNISGNASNSPQIVALSGVGTNLVCPTISISTNLPDLSASIYFSQSLQATGGVAPYAFVVTDGSLPAGLALTSGGAIAGIPTANGTNVFTIQASDAFGCVGSQVYTQSVACPSLTIEPAVASLPMATNGVTYSQALSVTTNGWAVGGTFRYDNYIPLAFTGDAASGLLVSNVANVISNVTVSLFYTNTVGSTLPSLSLIGPDGTTVGLIGASSGSSSYGTGCGQRFGFDSTSSNANPRTCALFNNVLTCTLNAKVGTFRPDDSLTAFTGKSGGSVNGLWQLQMGGASGGQLSCWSLSFNTPVKFIYSVVNPAALPPGLTLSSDGKLSGTPTQAGVFNFDVFVSGPTGCSQTRNYTVTVADGSAGVGFSPSLLSTFGDVVVGTTSNQTIVMSSTGNLNLVVTNFTFDGNNPGDFSVASSCLNTPFPPGNSCPIIVGFTPTTNGNRAANLIVWDNAPGAPHTNQLKGAGITPVISVVPTNVNFGTQPVGVSNAAPQWVQVYNVGDGPMTVTGASIISTNAQDFSIVANQCLGSPIQPGGSCSIGVNFNPGSTSGVRTATLLINSTATNGQQRVALQGRGTTNAPVMGVSPNALTFSDTVLGTTSQVQVVTVNNSGNAALVIGGVAFTNGANFSVLNTSCLGASLQPGQSCQIQVAFTPTQPGARFDALQILSNYGIGTNFVQVAGSGVGPFISLSSPSLEFGTNYQGTAGNQLTLTITNSGNASLVISNVTMGGLNPGDFTILSDSCVLSPILPGKTCKISLLFSTTTLLDRYAVLTIPGNAMNAPATVNLHGTGAIYPCQTIGLSPTNLPPAYNRVPYSQTITPVNGTGPFTFTSSGHIPVGLTLFPSGALAGTPAELGTNVFTIDVVDRYGCVGSQTYTIGVSCAELRLLPLVLPSATEGQFYDQQVQVTTTNGQILSSTTRFEDPVASVIPSLTTIDVTNVVAGLVGSVDNVRVSLYLTNPDLSDDSYSGISYDGLVLWLVGPDGTEVQLAGDQPLIGSRFPVGANLGNGCAANTNQVFFDSLSTNNIYRTAAPHIGTFAPDQSLNAFKGKSPNGIWRLRVQSNSHATVLNCWSLWVDGSTYTYGISAGALPNGLGLDYNTGHLSGTPAVNGTNTFTITATDASGGCTASNQYNLVIAPNPYNPSIRFDPPLLGTFGDVTLGTVSTSQTIIVHNDGSAALSVTNLTLAGNNPGEFVLNPLTTCITAIQPGGSCAINVQFAPTNSGNRSASIIVWDTAPGAPHTNTVKGAGIAPVITTLPSAVVFGNQPVGITSGSQFVTVRNTGDGPLTLSNVTVISTNAGDFTVTPAGCSAVPPGGDCLVSVTFKPGALGQRTATIVLTGNATNSPFRVPLVGTGVVTAASIECVPATVNFPATGVGLTGTVQNIIVTNTGTAALVITNINLSAPGQFTFAPVGCLNTPIPVGGTCNIGVQFMPTNSGVVSANLQIWNNSSVNRKDVPLSGFGIPPVITVNPTALDFGNQPQGITSTSLVVVVSNTGLAPLIITNVTTAGANAADFSAAWGGCSIVPPGGTCTVSVAFNASVLAQETAQLLIWGNVNTPAQVSLAGKGVPALPVLGFIPAQFPSFGDLGVYATSSVQSVTVTNIGNAPLVISNVVLAGSSPADFILTPGGCSGATIQPGNTCTIGVRFAPTASGNLSANVVITNNAGNPSVLTVQGRGITPVLTPAPAAVDFGTQTVGFVSAPLSVLTFNTGNGPLNITNISIQGPNAADFFVSSVSSSCLASAIQPGGNCIIGISYRPGAALSSTGMLVIAGTQTNGTQQVPLYGVGTIPAGAAIAIATPYSLDFGTQLVGGVTSPQMVYVSNVGNTWLTITDIQLGGLNPSDFSVASNACGFLLPGQTCQVPVYFHPFVTTQRTALLLINSTATNGQQQVALTGLGTSAAGVLNLTATNLDFGIQTNAVAPISRLVGIGNSGTAALLLTNLAITGVDAAFFTITSNTCAGAFLNPGNSCEVGITYSPSADGNRNAQLAIATAPGGVTNVTLFAGRFFDGSGVTNCPGVVIAITPNTLGTFQSGTALSQQFTASGGTAPYTFAIISGSIPGATLSTNGLLSGTIPSSGQYSFSIRAVDRFGCSGTQAYTIQAVCPSLTILPQLLPGGIVGAAYSQPVALSAGTPPFVYSVIAGGLPPGLIFNSSGYLAGTPTTAGTFAFTLRVANSSGCFADRVYSVVVSSSSGGGTGGGGSGGSGGGGGTGVDCSSSTLAFSTGALSNAQVGVLYSNQIVASGGVAPRRFYHTAGFIAPGITLSTNGWLTGTPTGGSGNFTATVTDANGCSVSRTYDLTVSIGPSVIVFTNPTLQAVSVGTPVTQKLGATGGTGTLTYSIVEGALPTGLTLSSSGELTGTATASGTATFTVQARDTAGKTARQQYTLNVNCTNLSPISPTTLAPLSLGVATSQQLSAGNGQRTFTLSGGTMPTGLNLSSGGLLGGTPTVSGTFIFTVSASAQGQCQPVSRTYTATVTCASVSITPTTLPNGQVGTIYSNQLTATGGAAPYVFALDAGTLPGGLALGADGLLTGTPTNEASDGVVFRVKVIDQAGCLTTRDYVVAIGAGSIAPPPTPVSKILVTNGAGVTTLKVNGTAGLVVTRTVNGDIGQVTVSGSNARTVLTITVKKARGSDGKVTIGSIVADGDLGIAANAVNIVGGGITIAGKAGTITLNGLEGANLSAGVSLKNVVIKRVAASNITAPSVGKVTLGEVVTNNGGTAFGVTSPVIGGVTVRTPRFAWSKRGGVDQFVGDFHVKKQ